ncbi:MAG: CHRD domain-containing protein [Chloroflexi bacterium]|nr:CHRD domain-containing protein [Chloroflexota bacterium]
MRALRAPLFGAIVAAAMLAVLLPASSQAQQSVTIKLAEQNNSDISGTATLTAEGNSTKVVLKLENAAGPNPAHIHAGSCPNVGAVVYPLASVTNGQSETTVAASLTDLLKGGYAINVHKSPQEIAVYVACGDLSAQAAGTGASVGAGAAPVAQPSPAAKPATTAPAAQPSPAAKPAAAQAPRPAASPAAQAPAQAPRPAASPSALPRTGEVDSSPLMWGAALGGLVLVVAGAFVIRRRRSA